MNKVIKRLLISVLIFVAIVVIYAYLYMIGAERFEGDDVQYYVALQTAVESITTAGFGGQAPWESAIMNVLVILMNLTGVAIFFFGIPIALAPVITPRLKEILDDDPQTVTDMSDHVVIIGYSDIDRTLIRRLDDSDISYVLILENRSSAKELEEGGTNVVWGSIDDDETVENANVDQAKYVIIDRPSEDNTSTILTVDRLSNEKTSIISVARDNGSSRHQYLAGADEVIDIKEELGYMIGQLSAYDVISRIVDEIPDDYDINVNRRVIRPSDNLINKTIYEASDSLDSPIIFGWFDGKLVPSLKPTRKITENSILVSLSDGGSGYNSQNSDGDIIIGGMGDVGKQVNSVLNEKGLSTTTIDIEDDKSDVQGDITDISVLQDCDIENARSLVLTINNDSDTINATLATKRVTKDTQIIARLNKDKNVQNLYQSGANYVLSMESLIGSSIAEYIEGIDTLPSSKEGFEIKTIDCEEYAGMKMKETDIREKHGFAILILRDEEAVARINGDTEIQEDDQIVLINTIISDVVMKSN